jgi:hypothetical protein
MPRSIPEPAEPMLPECGVCSGRGGLVGGPLREAAELPSCTSGSARWVVSPTSGPEAAP